MNPVLYYLADNWPIIVIAFVLGAWIGNIVGRYTRGH